MGLYLCVFDGDDELEGVEVGSYADFGEFRDLIAQQLEGGRRGSRFPVLMLHSDCEGNWAPGEAARLEEELRTIAAEMRNRPSVPFRAGSWQAEVARQLGLKVRTLLDAYIDVDGEPLVERLTKLAQIAQREGKPILFQ
jgi:hypothetical protein